MNRIAEMALVAALTAAVALPIARTAMAAMGHTISQTERTFAPAMLSVARGDTIAFVNDDVVTHNVTVTLPDGSRQSSGSQKPGEVFEIAAAMAGTHKVRCLIHPKMSMTLSVE